jgi:hypothetical protein
MRKMKLLALTPTVKTLQATPPTKINVLLVSPGHACCPRGMCGRKGTLFKAVSQLLWPQKVREEWFSLRENHERLFRFGLHQLRNRCGSFCATPNPFQARSDSAIGGRMRVLAKSPGWNGFFLSVPTGAGFPLWSALGRLAAVTLLNKVIDKFARGVVHLHVEGFHLAGEVVEGHHSRDGHQQPESRGHQSL